jgi:hypothetical protein
MCVVVGARAIEMIRSGLGLIDHGVTGAVVVACAHVNGV